MNRPLELYLVDWATWAGLVDRARGTPGVGGHECHREMVVNMNVAMQRSLLRKLLS